MAMLLGTAGTGKTTTLKAALAKMRKLKFGRVMVGAFTGVAASNVGEGARTLHDMFKLSKINDVSGGLMPLNGDDLEEFAKDMEGLKLLVIDEISMVSRVVLAFIDERLKEWREYRNHPAKDQPFGGVGVILAGDFGQLPPVKVAPSFSLLCSNAVHNCRTE